MMSDESGVDTALTFGDLELVVLLVPQTAALAVDDPDGELGVGAVGLLQGEVRRCVRKEGIRENLPSC